MPAKLDGKISAIKNALLKGSAKYGISLGSEILEEELQNFLEPAFRSIIFGEKYDMPTVQELIDTALVTALSTSAIEGPGITSETIQEYGNNNALKTATNSVQPEQSSPNAPETIDVGKIGWDGRVAVTEATGPKVTVDGKTYALIGKDANGSPVYQDVEVLREQNVSTKGETETYAVDKNSEELLENQGKDSTIQKDNKAVRQWYHDNVARIKDSIDTNLPVEEQARQAFEARNRLRTEARNRMLDQETRKLLDSKRPNLTIEELIESKMRRKAMTREEAIQDVLDTATKTNENVDRELGIGGK